MQTKQNPQTWSKTDKVRNSKFIGNFNEQYAILKVGVDKVAPTQNKNWGSPFFGGVNDVICQLVLGKKL